MNSTLLKSLLDLGDAFERAHPDPAEQNLSNFLAWLAPKPTETTTPLPVAQTPVYSYYDPRVPYLQTYISHAITKAYRYMRGYVRKAFEAAPLLNFDDFICLASLACTGSMSKTELVEVTINEKTSGMLVIKRLIDRGFIAQKDDEHDKRSKRLSITPEGLATLRALQPAMDQATAQFTGDLTEAEQWQLSALLTRLDKFHEPIYLAHWEVPVPSAAPSTK